MLDHLRCALGTLHSQKIDTVNAVTVHGYKTEVLHNQLAFELCISVKISGGISPAQILSGGGGGSTPGMKPCDEIQQKLDDVSPTTSKFGQSTASSVKSRVPLNSTCTRHI